MPTRRVAGFALLFLLSLTWFSKLASGGTHEQRLRRHRAGVSDAAGAFLIGGPGYTLDGKTAAVATVEAVAVRPVTSLEITHSRELTGAS
jgi:hypothetical protein